MDNRNLYEKFDWEALKSEDLKEKADLIRKLIPGSVKTILDVGCGNGAITNYLSDFYDITGLDRSASALSFVNTKKIQASADEIPLPDFAFDLVFSSELLEHLEEDVLGKSVKEISRIAKEYVLISVPNHENPDKLSIRCPECKYVFNRPNHLRSFTLQKLQKLFPEYQIISSQVSGKNVRYYNPVLLNIKRKISPAASWIPYSWIPSGKRKTFCPACENEFEYPYKPNILARSIDLINVVVSPKRPYWLIVLLKKK